MFFGSFIYSFLNFAIARIERLALSCVLSPFQLFFKLQLNHDFLVLDGLQHLVEIRRIVIFWNFLGQFWILFLCSIAWLVPGTRFGLRLYSLKQMVWYGQLLAIGRLQSFADFLNWVDGASHFHQVWARWVSGLRAFLCGCLLVHLFHNFLK